MTKSAASITSASSTTSSTTTAFDPTDLKYQAKKKYLPDKEKLWKYPKENDGWVHAHNAIRGELDRIDDCLEALQSRGGTLEQWEIDALTTVYAAHYDFIHMHHTNEDDILAPALQKRFVYPDKLTEDHDGIVTALADIKATIAMLKEGDDRVKVMTPLLEKWGAYSEDMKEHLLEEEEIGLPLARAYFKPHEMDKIVRKIQRRGNFLEIGTFIYHMGKDRCRTEFMKQHGLPFLLWKLVFGPARKLYERKIISLTKCLQSGTQPIPSTSSAGCLPRTPQ